VVAGLAGFAVWFAGSWREASLREASLPDLESQAQRSPYDGMLLAVLGARLAEADSTGDKATATDTLARALASGEADQEVVWVTLAATDAAVGDEARAVTILNKGQQHFNSNCPQINTALANLSALGPNPIPASGVQAILPGGFDSAVDEYTRRSFLNGAFTWWGRRYPDRSGFTTREQWAMAEPENAEALRLWGLALLENRRGPEAVKVLAQAVMLDPQSADANLAYAQSLESAGADSPASYAYLRALALQPHSVEALLGLGRTSQLAGSKYARAAFLRSTQVAPNSADAWIGLGHSDIGADEYLVECLGAFQKAATLAPNRTDFYDDYAEALTRNSDAGQAEALLGKRLTTNPNDAEAHYLLAGAILQDESGKGDLDRAKAEAEAALRLAPKSAVCARQLGDILLRQGDTQGAIGTLKAALSDNPYQVQAMRLLARAYAQGGQPALARQTAARAEKLFAAQQQLDVLVKQSDRRFLEPAYHRQLIALYMMTGQQSMAIKEEESLHMVLANPTEARRSLQDLQSSLDKALGQGAVSAE
jgi:tetratricopeptide (TPR) repeat protein